MKKLLIANRGEVAIRIARSAAELGLDTVAVHATDDSQSLHVRRADSAVDLHGNGAAAYLDMEAIVAAALAEGCDALHPGYGFLSENARFAAMCAEASITFVGPRPETLALFGDKAAARRHAEAQGVPVLAGISRAVSLEDVRDFMRDGVRVRPVMLKALAGGGGRGMRAVETLDELEAAYERCRSEALKAFGAGDLYVEELIGRARHVEIQVIGDGTQVSHLWDRECSIQRQRQKLLEIAPAFGLPPAVRGAMLEAAVQLARAAGYAGLGTFEFLVDAGEGANGRFVFMEANPRLQVEHTVTEEILGLDLVAAQLRVATGATLAELGLSQETVPHPSGAAIQARINLETLAADGSVRPSGGTVAAYDPPAGAGVRVDGAGYTGYVPNPRYDSLLAKVIVMAPDLAVAAQRLRRSLAEFRILGPASNIPLLQALLRSDALDPGILHTRLVDERLADLVAGGGDALRHFAPPAAVHRAPVASVDPEDPLAVLSVRPCTETVPVAAPHPLAATGPEGSEAVAVPLQGLVTKILVAEGDRVRKGQPLFVAEALKMEHVISAPFSGKVREIAVAENDPVFEGQPVLFLEPVEIEGNAVAVIVETAADPDFIRADLKRIHDLHAMTGDAHRVEATRKRHAAGKRTARENIADLCDADSFVEYGPLVTSARFKGESDEKIAQRIAKTPGDGLVMGIGKVNGAMFPPETARCVALSYDYSVMAGTQGDKNHEKTDRMLQVAARCGLPVVFFTEGGGGRMSEEATPESIATTTGGLKVDTWRLLGRLSGRVPLVGVTSGRCFAGNAVILALMDVVIATRDSTIGIGGPAMIEGGGLGMFAPEEVGPVAIQAPNGVIDILVEDEAEATEVAKRYLSYFQGRVFDWEEQDQRVLRHIVPENRRAIFDIRKLIGTMADAGSMLELRREFAPAMVTAFIRIEGRPVGVIANNSNSPTGGAVDSDAADKAARFMQLCDGFDLPLVTLLDVPGNMVGPEAERTATVRHCGRLYVTGANLDIPVFSVVLRKAYGLGALAMSGGSFENPLFTVAWPTGEFAGMGIEGSIKLGRRAELLALDDIPARRARYEELVSEAYAWAGAVNGATVFEFDDVIDPADTRRWLAMGLEAAASPRRGRPKRRSSIDTW